MNDLEKLKKKHAAELEKARAENEIHAALDTIGCGGARVFQQKDETWITYGDDYRAPGVHPEFLTLLASVLPGKLLVWYKDSCSSVITQEQRDTETAEYRAEGPAAPWHIETEHDQRGLLSWHTQIGYRKIFVRCILNHAQARKVGGVKATRHEFKGGYRTETVLRACDPSMYTIEDADGVPVAEFGGPGCWVYGAGSPEAAGRASLTWTPIDADRAPTVADFVRALVAN